MKIFIKLAVMLIISLVGCSDSNNTKNLDLTSDEYWRDYDATILFDIDSEDGAYGVILVRGHVTSGGLSIDNTPVVIDSWSYSGTVNYSSAWFYFNENIDLSASHSFNFISNVKSVSGTIKFPQSLAMTWPEVAYSNKNFEFNWQVTESPSTYIFGMDAEDEDYNEVE
ncbi:hypothetical protein L6Q79_16110, partial [bacterium]|nr:hypothetical protein [bacterium]